MRLLRILPIVLAASLLSGCGSDDLTTPKGPVFAFNPGEWQPEPGDLTVPPTARQ